MGTVRLIKCRWLSIAYIKLLSLIFFVLISSSIYSQNKTEKYNSLMNRYEYFDSSGNMVGYKTYNSLMRQWEYYETSNSSRKTDYGEVYQPVNLGLAHKVMASKQDSYNANVKAVQYYITKVNTFISNKYTDERTRNMALETFSQAIESVNKQNVDFSSNKATRHVLNYLYEQVEFIVKTYK